MKTLKFLVPAAFFLAAFSFTARAQGLTEQEPDPYNREIGFGTNILLSGIFNSNPGPLDFMYRWRSGNGYWRIGTSVAYSKGSHFQLQNQNVFQEYFRSTLGLGREWRQEVAKRWSVNYGTDLVFNYRQNFRQSENVIYNTEIKNIQRDYSKYYGGSLRPFLGVMFKINQRLYIGTEASLAVALLKKFQELESYQVEGGQRIEENTETDDFYPRESLDISISTSPASNIFLYYRF